MKSNLLKGLEGFAFLCSGFISGLNWILQCTFSLLVFRISAKHFILISTHELYTSTWQEQFIDISASPGGRETKNLNCSLRLCPAHNLSKWYLRDLPYKMITERLQKVQEQNSWTEEKGQAQSNVAPPFASGAGNDSALKEFQGTGSSCVCLLLLPPFPCHQPLPALDFLPDFNSLQGTTNLLINIACALKQ